MGGLFDACEASGHPRLVLPAVHARVSHSGGVGRPNPVVTIGEPDSVENTLESLEHSLVEYQSRTKADQG